MNAKINSLVADSVRQGCRQLDGYLQDLIVSTKRELRDSVVSIVAIDGTKLALATLGPAVATTIQATTDDLAARVTLCLDEFSTSARAISLQILDDFENQARCLSKFEIEPLINAQIEAVVLKELQKAQQILIEEREETVRIHNKIRKAMLIPAPCQCGNKGLGPLGRPKSFSASWYSETADDESAYAVTASGSLSSRT